MNGATRSLAAGKGQGEGRPIEPFVALMRRYCVDYTNRHDLSICAEIMEPDYTLNMGVHRLVGRDKNYKPAAAIQFRQFPGLCLTVNQIVTNGDRLVLRFTEHGRSIRHEGRAASWSGIGLYRWNGQKLLENFVEQDYFSRAAQLAGGAPLAVEAPAIAPWDTQAEPVNPEAEALVRDRLESGAILDETALLFDEEWTRPENRDRVLDPVGVQINDMFSAGNHVAFHIAVTGRLRRTSALGTLAAVAGDDTHLLHLAALVRVQDGRIVWGRGVRDRIGLKKRLERRAR